MVRFDTITFEVPPQCILNQTKTGLVETQRTDCGTGVVDRFLQVKPDLLPIGFSSLKFRDGGNWQVTMSAKTLLDNYLQGVNLNTFTQSLHLLNPIFEVDPQRLWDANPKVLKCDTTDNVVLDVLGTNHKGVVDAIVQSLNNPYFTPTQYAGRGQCGVVLQGKRVEKNRLICYAKHLDLSHPKNKSFRANLKNPLHLYNQSEKQIRIEVNHTTFRSIRERLKIPTNNLQQVLMATHPVNHDFLLKTTGGGKQLLLFAELDQYRTQFGETFRPNDYLMMQGVKGVVQDLGYCYTTCKRFFEQLYQNPNTFKYHWTKKGGMSLKYQIVKLIETHNHETGKVGGTNKVTQNLLNALKVAV